MEQSFNTLKAALYERVSSPLFRTFVFSWLAVNHEIFFVFFSKDDAATKLDLINNVLYPGFWSLPLLWLVVPICLTLLFLILYPWPAQYFNKRWVEFENALKEDKGKKLLSEEESRDVRLNMERINIGFDNIVNKKEAEIRRLENIIESYKKEKEEKERSASEEARIYLDLTENQRGFINLLLRREEHEGKSFLLSSELCDELRIEFHAIKLIGQELGRLSLINSEPDSKGENVRYMLTNKGRKVSREGFNETMKGRPINPPEE